MKKAKAKAPSLKARGDMECADTHDLLFISDLDFKKKSILIYLVVPELLAS
jgi:hypothetical protein